MIDLTKTRTMQGGWAEELARFRLKGYRKHHKGRRWTPSLAPQEQRGQTPWRRR